MIDKKAIWLTDKEIEKKVVEKKLSSVNYSFSNINIDKTLETIKNLAFQVNIEIKENILQEAKLDLIVDEKMEHEQFDLVVNQDNTYIISNSSLGFLYGIYDYLSMLSQKEATTMSYKPYKKLRLLNHWDNLEGTVERGYAGESIFYYNNELTTNKQRLEEYAKILTSLKINYIVINNVNVSKSEAEFLNDKAYIVKEIKAIFNEYNIKIMISLNFASPTIIGNLETFDPLNQEVVHWWTNILEKFYKDNPGFGGFLIKADSEGMGGPHKYNRTHADGANMIGKIIRKWDSIVIWRCFVYNCKQDWRDTSIDRVKAVYENFIGLDGKFLENVYLQVKNGPLDFQVREPITPLFGAMKKTKLILELQMTQEYTGQQIHLCNLLPMWHDIFHTNTGHNNLEVIDTVVGVCAVANVGASYNWTGHFLAQCNLYGYGMIINNKNIEVKTILSSWVSKAFKLQRKNKTKLVNILYNSYFTYEKYTSPLGIGGMMNPQIHYGPNVDGYEYSKWGGSYHKATKYFIGYNRTTNNGSNFTAQYSELLKNKYESLSECPENLLLFFHKLPYDYSMKSKKTIIQHIYDSHFEGVEEVEEYLLLWSSLKEEIPEDIYNDVKEKFFLQLESAKEWRDVINSYFYRRCLIEDEKGRKIYG